MATAEAAAELAKRRAAALASGSDTLPDPEPEISLEPEPQPEGSDGKVSAFSTNVLQAAAAASVTSDDQIVSPESILTHVEARIAAIAKQQQARALESAVAQSLRAELELLSLGKLRKRALAEGIPEDAIDEVDDCGDLIDLILLFLDLSES